MTATEPSGLRLEPGPAPAVGSRGIKWAAGAALLAASWAINGYQVYHSNQAIQLPLVAHLAHPALFRGDAFVHTLSGYAAPIWWLIARATRFLPLEPLLFVLFLVTKICLLLAAASLAGAIRPRSALAPWAGAAVAALGIGPLLASGTITSSYFEHTAAAIPLFLWAFAALVRGKPWRWALLCAIGVTLNPMYGLYALTYSLLGLLVLHRRTWPRWLVPLLCCGLLSAPTFLMAAHAHSAQAADPSFWLQVAEASGSRHLFPRQWPLPQFFEYGLVALLVLVLARARPPDAPEAIPGNRFAAAATVCGFAWLAVAYLAPYVLRSPGLVVLHPGRATDLWCAVCALFLVAHFSWRLECDLPTVRPASVLGLVASILLLSRQWPQELPVVPFVLLILLLQPRVWQRLTEQPQVSTMAVRLAALVCFLALLHVGLRGVQRGTAGFYTYGVSARTRQVARWARDHSDTGALFIVPPEGDWYMFRALADRGVVGVWRDGTGLLWNRPFASEWVRRMHLLGKAVLPRGATPWPVAASVYPTGWSDQQLSDVARTFGADFCVLPADHPTRLPVVYQGSMGYKVVKAAG